MSGYIRQKMKLLCKTLTKFRDALLNHQNTLLPYSILSDYEGRQAKFNRDFCGTRINDPEINPIILGILNNLQVPDYQMGRYLHANLCVYDFFIELYKYNKKENNKLKQFNALLDEKIKISWGAIFGYGLLSASAIGCFIPAIKAAGGFTFIQKVMALALFFPVVGLVFTTVIATYSVYKKQSDERISYLQRCRDNAFLVANTVFKIAAYSVTLAAVTTMVPVASILNVVASVINIIREVVNIIALGKQDSPVALGALISEQQQHVRDKINYTKLRNSIIINIASATALTAVVALWCFIPGGVFISVAAFVLMGLISLTEFLLQKYNENKMEASLQQQFTDLEEKYQASHPEPRPGLEDSKSLEHDMQNTPEMKALNQISNAIMPTESNVMKQDSVARQLRQVGLFATTNDSQGRGEVMDDSVVLEGEGLKKSSPTK